MTTSEQAAREAVYNAAFIHNIDHKGKHLAERCPQFTAALDALTAAIEQRVRREALTAMATEVENLEHHSWTDGDTEDEWTVLRLSDVEDVHERHINRKKKADA